MVFPCSGSARTAAVKQLTEFTGPYTITSIKISKFHVELISFSYFYPNPLELDTLTWMAAAAAAARRPDLNNCTDAGR